MIKIIKRERCHSVSARNCKKVLQRKGKIVNVMRVYDMRTLFASLLYADPDGGRDGEDGPPGPRGPPGPAGNLIALQGPKGDAGPPWRHRSKGIQGAQGMGRSQGSQG